MMVKSKDGSNAWIKIEGVSARGITTFGNGQRYDTCSGTTFETRGSLPSCAFSKKGVTTEEEKRIAREKNREYRNKKNAL